MVYLNNKNCNNVLLITLHNDKSLGIRCLAQCLKSNGFEPTIVFFKSNIYSSQYSTDIELRFLLDILKKKKYLFVGLSILSSYILSEICKVNEIIKKNINVPIVWGGIYPTLCPEKCAKYCDILVRGEGEIAIVKLAETLQKGGEWRNLPNICYYDQNKNYHENMLTPLIQDLDSISYSNISNEEIYFIDSNKVVNCNPSLNTDFYEISCSRGCPFSCSYCSSSKLRDIYRGNGKYFRFRSVDSVIAELSEAVQKNPNIKEIRFWDEVFTTNKEWIEEFSIKYKEKIGLRCVIWGHPLLIKKEELGMLVDAGLRRIIVGFQSGSSHVRNKIFKRPETNEQIIKASKILSSYPLLEVYYDLIICHVLESVSEIKETFDLCLQLASPFNLQIHGLSFLPKTDIVQTIIDKGLYTVQEMEDIFNSSSEENYRQWDGPRSDYYADNPEKEVWADLIYLTQFAAIRNKVIKLSKNPDKNKNIIKKLKIKIENMEYEKQEILKRPMTLVNKIIKIPDLIF